ncbi:hypothetical protein RIF29_41359 [Crotalaria pallida]|uniref:Uncharacterized protein n=1 Tax=Crotalaria pallida TaxID=3830 RepID=A0AAN9EAE4_CROPI
MDPPQKFDPTYSAELLRHLDKQKEVLEETYKEMRHELEKLMVEERMLMQKRLELISADALTKKGILFQPADNTVAKKSSIVNFNMISWDVDKIIKYRDKQEFVKDLKESVDAMVPRMEKSKMTSSSVGYSCNFIIEAIFQLPTSDSSVPKFFDVCSRARHSSTGRNGGTVKRLNFGSFPSIMLEKNHFRGSSIENSSDASTSEAIGHASISCFY